MMDEQDFRISAGQRPRDHASGSAHDALLHRQSLPHPTRVMLRIAGVVSMIHV